jgi:hypothetical protein
MLIISKDKTKIGEAKKVPDCIKNLLNKKANYERRLAEVEAQLKEIKDAGINTKILVDPFK